LILKRRLGENRAVGLVKVTYNGITSFSQFDKNQNPLIPFFLRIYFAYFLKPRQTNFEVFEDRVRTFQYNPNLKLGLAPLLEAIAADLKKEPSDETPTILLAIDEVHVLFTEEMKRSILSLFPHLSLIINSPPPLSQKHSESRFGQIFLAIQQSFIEAKKFHLFPLFAGTMRAPLEELIQSENVKLTSIPIRLLSLEERLTILRCHRPDDQSWKRFAKQR